MTTKRVKCAQCRRFGKSKKALPFGWKRLPVTEKPCCPPCWKKLYVLRAVTFPVARPEECSGGEASWPMFRAAIASAWAKSTSLANWIVTELMKRDVVRTSGMRKLPPMPEFYSYGIFEQFEGRQDWNGAASSACSLMRAVEAKYRESRYPVIWLRKEAPPTFRYPYPYPVHNKDWRPVRLDDGGSAVSIALPSFEFDGEKYPGGRWLIRLRGGQEFRRQLADFAAFLNGSAIKCEAAIHEGRERGSSHRGTINGRNELGDSAKTRPMVKLVGWFPRRQPDAPRTESMLLMTHAESFLVAVVAGSQPWVLNADDLREQHLQMQHLGERHTNFRRRLSQDMKFEKRWPKARRRVLLAKMRQRCDKHNRRINTHIDQCVASVVKYAERRRVATVAYDDRDRGYMESFKWSRLKTILKQRFEAKGIEFIASGPTVDETPEPARDSQGGDE